MLSMPQMRMLFNSKCKELKKRRLKYEFNSYDIQLQVQTVAGLIPFFAELLAESDAEKSKMLMLFNSKCKELHD